MFTRYRIALEVDFVDENAPCAPTHTFAFSQCVTAAHNDDIAQWGRPLFSNIAMTFGDLLVSLRHTAELTDADIATALDGLYDALEPHLPQEVD